MHYQVEAKYECDREFKPIAQFAYYTLADDFIKFLKARKFETFKPAVPKLRVRDLETNNLVPFGFELSRSPDCKLPPYAADTMHLNKPIFEI